MRLCRDSEAEADKRGGARITECERSRRAGYANYQQWVTGSKLEQKISLEDYSVSNRGLKAGFVGTPEAGEAPGWKSSAAVGVDLVLLQSSPQAEEMERFCGAGDGEAVKSAWSRQGRLACGRFLGTADIIADVRAIINLSIRGCWRVGRVAEGDGLLNRCTGKPVPGVRIPHSPP